MCSPVQVLQEVGLWAIGQTENFTQQRQQVNSLEPGVTVTGLRRQRRKDTLQFCTGDAADTLVTLLKMATELKVMLKFKTPPHLQRKVDLILDVLDDVAFDS